MRLALCQVPCVLGDKERNLDNMENIVGSTDADLFVFAESFLTGYMIRDMVGQLAEPIEGESVGRVAKISEMNDAHIMFGMPVRDENISGLLKNSNILVSPNGLVQRYDKLNLATFGPFEEGLYFSKGESPVLFEVNEWRIAPMICYDVFFSELAKSYALNGADMGICISASPITSRDFFETVIPSRAIENTMYFAYVNQVGTQLNQVFFGGSFATSPRGQVLTKNKYFEQDVKVVDLKKEEVNLARRMRPTIRDSLSSQ